MKHSIISSLCLVMLGMAIWWMSANAVWLGDDIDYKYMMKGEIWQSWGKIKTAKAFLDSQLIHYHNVNGRFVAHSLVQLFNARLGQEVFAICNGAVYMFFALLIGIAGGVKFNKNTGGIISAISLSVLCFITKMMPTCQIGYIWGMTANIGWLMLFYKKGNPSWPTSITMTLAGIIVGNWQESISIGVCGGLGVWWIIQWIDSRKSNTLKFEWRRSWMILGYVAGTATNCLAPSTIGRVSDIAMPLTDQLLIASYSYPAVAMLIIVILYQKFRHVKIHIFTFRNSEGAIPEGPLTLGLLLLIAFNIVIGVYSNRQLFGANLFAAILTLRITPRHRFATLLNITASIAVLAFWMLMIIGINEVKRQYNEIGRLHAESSDGSVYYDRTRVMTLGFPLRAKYYEDILGQFDNDLHHSIMKDFKQIRKGRTLKLKPTVNVEGELAVCFAPAHFTVTLKEPPKGEAPREIILYGHYPILGIKSEPRKIQVTRYSNRSKSYSTAVIIPEFPFFITDSIKIVPYNLGCGTNQPIATP